MKKSDIVFLDLGKLANKLQKDSFGFILIDRVVAEQYPELVQQNKHMLLEASESEKNLEQLETIYRRFHEEQITRDHTVYAIGGGCVTDIAGFAAATWKRGCRLVIVPTTLLAMVDAAVGGKNGINFLDMKNAVGTFYNPAETILTLEFLDSLPEVQILCGFAEIVKIALLGDNPLYAMLEEDESPLRQEVIEQAIKEKMRYCAIDPHDRGERAKLNLGHTFGHLIESVSDFVIPHGIAVALGIRFAASFSSENGWLSQEDELKINAFLDRFGLPDDISPALKQRITKNGAKILHADKKRATTHLKLVCFNGFRSVFLHECNDVNRILELFE